MMTRRDQIERIGADDPLVNAHLHMVRMGDWTWEEAMERCVIALAEQKHSLAVELEDRVIEVPDNIVVKVRK